VSIPAFIEKKIAGVRLREKESLEYVAGKKWRKCGGGKKWQECGGGKNSRSAVAGKNNDREAKGGTLSIRDGV
jgi:hypothetical protein